MRLWRRASGVIKDQNSLWLATLSTRTALRNPDIESAVIKATSHDGSSFESRNIERVCRWVSLSPFNLKPLLWSVSNRVEKTRNWVVALKGLYLMHNVMNCSAPCVELIGRLPFDLSNFKDGHSCQAKTWAYSAFIRAYFLFLDQKATIIFQRAEEKKERATIKQELTLLQKLQSLIDLLMQIKPQARASADRLVLEAMDSLIIDVFDNYSQICSGIAIVLMNIYSATKAEAVMTLNVVRKATSQGEELSLYFQYCREVGVANASESPSVDRIPEEGIQELEQIINGFSERRSVDEWVKNQEDDRAIVVAANPRVDDSSKKELRAIITEKWEKFEEDPVQKNPFVSPRRRELNQDLPDLITF